MLFGSSIPAFLFLKALARTVYFYLENIYERIIESAVLAFVGVLRALFCSDWLHHAFLGAVLTAAKF